MFFNSEETFIKDKNTVLFIICGHILKKKPQCDFSVDKRGVGWYNINAKRKTKRKRKMDPRKYIEFLNTVEKLKCNTRHSWTSSGRRESVAEHTWRLSLMALLCADEYPHLDINKVIKMCIIHDLGEAITGDVPSFFKTDAHEKKEDEAIDRLLSMLPDGTREEFSSLYAEMEAKKTDEARLYKALDNMEAVVSHNEADISTWIEFEYSENLVYGAENAEFSEWTRALRRELREDSERKIAESKEKQ